MSAQLGKLKRMNPKKMWPNEASDFTPWLASNLDVLGQALGMELELEKEEADVGDFSLDILARDLGTNRRVVIENQYDKTNHDHLGKLITYAAGLDAASIIWVAENIREEHRQALDWLNQHTSSETAFFGVVVELLQIDDSPPAVNFKLVVFPNEWQRIRRASVGEQTPKGEAYRSFFQLLIDELREKHNFTKARAGQPVSWYSFSSGLSGITFGFSFAQGNRVRVEVYIDSTDGERNKRIFDELHHNHSEIEKDLSLSLSWERLDDKRASRIATYQPGSVLEEPERLHALRNWGIATLMEFKRVFTPQLKKAIGSLR